MINENLAIEVRGLTKFFDKKCAVNKVNLEIYQGEIFGFMGPNGSGKTTTIRMLCGLLTPTAGEGHCLGYDILEQSQVIRQNVGYMTQHFSLYCDLSIRENLDFIANIYDIKNKKNSVLECEKKFGFSEISNQLVETLSSGWRQRLSLAATILQNPKLLLLDEPTAGLDPKARRDFWDYIHELSAKGITTLVSTHYSDEAQRCHRLAYISAGRLLAKGHMSKIIQDANLSMWVVSGKNIGKLSEELRKLPAVDQVTTLGAELHVVGSNAEALENAIMPYREHYKCEQKTPTLEDVFINMEVEAVKSKRKGFVS